MSARWTCVATVYQLAADKNPERQFESKQKGKTYSLSELIKWLQLNYVIGYDQCVDQSVGIIAP